MSISEHPPFAGATQQAPRAALGFTLFWLSCLALGPVVFVCGLAVTVIPQRLGWIGMAAGFVAFSAGWAVGASGRGRLRGDAGGR